MSELTRDEVTSVIDGLVDELLQQAGITQPPVDALQLAREHLGVIICTDRNQPQRGRAQRSAGQRLIYLRPEPTEERQQWTVAHEIGEHFKVTILERLRADPEDLGRMTGESLANLFAYRLLVPTGWFADDAPAIDFDLLELKRRYRTSSHEVIALRMLDLPDPCAITILDNDRVTKRRSNAWRVTRQLVAAETECQRAVSAMSAAQRVQKDGWTAQGWPVHQSDWKREILRSVFEE